MWQSYVNGLLVALGLIMAIGTQNALCWPRACAANITCRWRRCVACDALLVAAGVFGLDRVGAEPDLAGGGALGRRRLSDLVRQPGAAPGVSKQSLDQGENHTVRSLRAVMLSALAVTLLNPHVYLDTVLLIGSLGAQQTARRYVVGAASASLLWFFTLARRAWLAPWLARPSTWRTCWWQ
jgi:L-lysine exporter family protein LysE/ArgO